MDCLPIYADFCGIYKPRNCSCADTICKSSDTMLNLTLPFKFYSIWISKQEKETIKEIVDSKRELIS